MVIPCVRGMVTDICTQGPRATGPGAEGVYISQIMSTHGITNMCHLFVHILCGRVLMKLPYIAALRNHIYKVACEFRL